MERFGIPKELVKKAASEFRKENPGKENVPDYKYREVRKRPLLVLHLLQFFNYQIEQKDRKPENAIGAGIPGYSISFPKTRRKGELVQYVVNTTWWTENFIDETEEEDE